MDEHDLNLDRTEARKIDIQWHLNKIIKFCSDESNKAEKAKDKSRMSAMNQVLNFIWNLKKKMKK